MSEDAEVYFIDDKGLHLDKFWQREKEHVLELFQSVMDTYGRTNNLADTVIQILEADTTHEEKRTQIAFVQGMVFQRSIHTVNDMLSSGDPSKMMLGAAFSGMGGMNPAAKND